MNSLLMLACIFGLMLLFGGGSLLRGLFGVGGTGIPGGGGLFPGGSATPRRSNPFGGFGGGSSGNSGSTGRGFRSSSRQNRSVPRIRNNKDGGGSAGLG
jgi:hypothetical protein